jgi:hypothetical protein
MLIKNEILNLPANYFIRKPIDNELLMKRINEIIADEAIAYKYCL